MSGSLLRGTKGESFARSKWSREERVSQLRSPWNEHVVISGKGNLLFPLLNIYLGQGGKIRLTCQNPTGVVKIQIPHIIKCVF